MGEEIESLYALLGIKPDEASAADAVSKLVKAVQSKLKSSVYGGKDGVITLPATLEGKFKNGKEINQDIKDAYAAIYKTAKEMADESVSLTLKDIENFKAQIDKFGKKTAKYKGSDVIANANNNLRQTLGDYQAFVNDLRKEVSVQQKAQTKQAQKAKAQAKAKTRKSSYSDISDEEINDAIAKENARQAKIKAWRDKQASDIASKLDYKSGGIDAGKTNSYSLNASEFSEYESQWARELAKTIKETYKTTVDKQWIDKEYKPKTGAKSRATSREEHLNFLSNAAFGDLADLIHKSEQGDEDVTFDKIVEAIGVLRTIMEENGKDMATIAQTVINATQSRYDDNPRRKNAGVNREEGTEKGVGKGHERTQAYQASIQQLLKKMLGEVGTIKQKEIEANKTAVKMTNAYEQAKSDAKTSKASADTKALAQELKGEKSRDDRAYIQDVRESSREGAADTAEAQKNAEMLNVEQQDVDTGFNTDSKADDLIRTVEKSKENDKNKDKVPKQVKDVLGQVATTLANLNLSGKSATPISTSLESAMCPCQDILTQIAESAKNIDVNLGNVIQQLLSLGAKLPNNLPALIEGETVKDKPVDKEPIVDKTNIAKIVSEHQSRQVDHDRAEAIVKNVTSKMKEDRQEKQKMYEALFKTAEVNNPGPSKLQNSRTQISPFQYNDSKIYNAIKKAFGVDETRKNARDISKMTQSEQEKLRAERISKFGLSRGGRDTDTGDIAQTYRTRRNFGWGKNIENPFQDLKITDGIDIDTTAITEALQNAIQKNMFNAQTGGLLKNIIGPATLYAGQPSLEKSRAEIDAANSIMAEIRTTVQNILNDILSKETDLKGLVDSGQAVFENGKLVQDTSKNGAATKLFADLEDQKQALRGVLADAGMVEETVERTGGNVTRILQQLGFVAPELRKCNTIVQNLNSGLDKNGKALKFQTRTAEVLNYSFQLMARNIGQMIKNWLALLNPINLIKRAFSDFASYDVKWQRTMNVIKYNLRRIIMPAMQWIAQQIVNVIGLVNALIKGIGSVFGQNWDLFDQSAASAEQMREELEQAANVTASFDELHDIGTSSSGNPAMDLMGDIYTPQWTGLYEILENVGKGIGEVFKFVGKVIEDIQKTTEGWTFWDWLLLAGAAVAGFLALKWLIGIFKGKNPLQSVADGLNFLEKAVGWAILIWSVTEFTKALKDFVDCMKTADWDDIAKSLSLFGGALSELGIVLLVLMVVAKIVGTTFLDSLGIAAMIAAFSLFVFVLTNFAETMKSLTEDDVINALALLGGALLEITLVLITLSAVFTALVGTGYGTLAIILLGVILVIVGLIVVALTEFVKALKDAGDDVKLALEGCAELFQTIGEQIVASILATGMAISMIIATIINGIIGIINSVVNGIAKIIQTIGNVIMGIIDTIGRSIERIVISVGKSISLIISTVAKSIIGIIDSLAKAFETVGNTICKTVEIIASAIDKIVTSIANGITTVLTPILTFVDKVISKLVELASTVVKEIGQTIRSIIETVGNVIIRIIQEVLNAVPRLLNSILSFCWNIGPAIENSASAIMRTITRIVNFIISAVEYLVNTVIWGLNNMARAANNVSQLVGIKFGLMTYVSIPRFIPQYETGTNYVPNDGLAYLHQGEAVIPKKYNTPYQPDDSRTEDAIDRLAQVVAQIEAKVDQGIPVKGEFVQRGSDLVAVVDRVNNKISNNILNNRVYAR